jgi:hypothetical protein
MKSFDDLVPGGLTSSVKVATISPLRMITMMVDLVTSTWIYLIIVLLRRYWRLVFGEMRTRQDRIFQKERSRRK